MSVKETDSKMRPVAFVAALLLCVLCMDQVCVQVEAKSVINSSKSFSARNEDEMRAILEQYNTEASKLCNKAGLANWDVQTHVDDPDEYSKVQVRLSRGPLLDGIT